MSLTIKQLKIMAEMQSNMNAKVDPYWLTSGNNWLLAAGMESAECIDHLSWKWWKKQSPDIKQAQMELVDIFHFLLSDLMVRQFSNPASWVSWDNSLAAYNWSRKEWNSTHDLDSHFRGNTNIEILTRLVVACFRCDHMNIIPLFAESLRRLEMTPQDLFRMYIGKNTLNLFRQDHGYKDGSYQKIWLGEEDNIHLERILSKTYMNAPNVAKRITYQLSQIYTKHLGLNPSDEVKI